MSRSLKVSSSAVSKRAMIKLALMRTATGKEEVTSAAEDMFIRVNCPSDCSPNKCFTEFKEQTHLNINCSETA
jgi:hypothetical protein